MSVFKQFEQANKRCDAGEKAVADRRKLEGFLDSYTKQTTKELNDVFKVFDDNKLFNGFHANSYEGREYSHQDAHTFGVKQVYFTIGRQGGTPEHTPGGPVVKLVDEIVEAAQKKDIPVVSAREVFQGKKNDKYPFTTPTIEVKKSIKEEDGSVVLLKALAAYAKTKGNIGAEKAATDAAHRMELLNKQLSRQEVEGIGSGRSIS